MSARTHSTQRRRRTALVAAVVVLALGGLSACELEEAGTEKATSDNADASSGGGSEKKKGAGEEPEGPRAAGETAVYADKGLKVTVGAPAPFTPNEYAAGHKQANQAYKIKVTLENTGSKKIDTALVTVGARQGDDGETTSGIFDGETIGEGFSGKLLPGKRATTFHGFDAAKGAKTLDIEVSVNDFETEPAQWSLKL